MSQGITLVISIVFLAYFGRKLSKQEMALYAWVSTLSSWVILFSGLGLATLACREVPTLIVQGKKREATRLISSAIAYRTLLAIMVSVALLFLSPLLSRKAFGTDAYDMQFRVIAGLSLITSVYSTLSLMQWALQRFHVRAAADLLMNTGGRLLAVIGFWYGGINGFLIGLGAGLLVAAGVQLWSLRDHIGRELMPFKSAAREGAAYTGADMLRNLLMNLDQPIVGFLIGDAALAEFFVAKRLYASLFAALQAVTGPVGAKISEVKVAGAAALNDYFRKSLVVISFLFIPAGFGLIFMSAAMLQVLAGPKYVSSAPVLSLFGVTMILGSTYEIWSEAVMRLLPGYFVILQNVVISLATYAMYAVFLPLMGAKGIPLAAGVGGLIATATAYRLVRTRAGLRFPVEPYCRSVLCGLLVMGATYMASHLGTSFVGLAAMVMAGTAAFAVGVLYLRPPEAQPWVQAWTGALARLVRFER